MRCAILHSAEAFEALGERWDALARASDAGLFLSHRWLSAWWRAFHGVDELWVFTVEDDAGALVGGWPLHLRAPRLDLRAASVPPEFARTRQPQPTAGGAVYAPADIDVLHGLDELLRLLRKEWAAREAASPAADPQAVAFLHAMVPDLHGRGI